jgi:hypothetical protein
MRRKSPSASDLTDKQKKAAADFPTAAFLLGYRDEGFPSLAGLAATYSPKS